MDPRFTKQDGSPTPLTTPEKDAFRKVGLKSGRNPLDDPQRLEIARRALAGDAISEADIRRFGETAEKGEPMGGGPEYFFFPGLKSPLEKSPEALATYYLMELLELGRTNYKGSPLRRAARGLLDGFAMAEGMEVAPPSLVTDPEAIRAISHIKGNGPSK